MIRGNSKNPAGRNRNHPLSPESRRARKRMDAARRAAKWAALPPEGKLAVIAQRPGKSARERARLGKKAA